MAKRTGIRCWKCNSPMRAGGKSKDGKIWDYCPRCGYNTKPKTKEDKKKAFEKLKKKYR